MTGMSGSLGSTQPVRGILGSKVRMVVYLGQKGITAMWGRGVGEIIIIWCQISAAYTEFRRRTNLQTTIQ